MKSNRSMLILVTLAILGILFCTAWLYSQDKEIRSLQNTNSGLEDDMETLKDENMAYLSRIEELKNDNSALEAKNEELSMYLNLSLNYKPSETETFSRYIKLEDGGTRWVTVKGTDEIIAFLNANFCMHKPSRVDF